MNFAIHDEFGKILKVVSCAPADVELQYQPPLQHIEIAEPVTDETHFIEAGQLVRLPPKPSQHHTFDFVKKLWVEAESLRDATVLKLKQELEELTATFPTKFGVFQTDFASQQRIVGAILAKVPVAWTLADNTIVQLTTEELTEVWSSFSAFQQELRAKYSRLKETIQSAPLEQLSSISLKDKNVN